MFIECKKETMRFKGRSYKKFKRGNTSEIHFEGPRSQKYYLDTYICMSHLIYTYIDILNTVRVTAMVN